MRIRTTLIAAAALAAALTVVVVAALVGATRAAQQRFDAQIESQQIARDVASLLALTNEFSVLGGERAAAQWRTRHDQLAGAIRHALARREGAEADLLDLQRDVATLPPLFDRLAEIGAAPRSSRRRTATRASCWPHRWCWGCCWWR